MVLLLANGPICPADLHSTKFESVSDRCRFQFVFVLVNSALSLLSCTSRIPS